MEQYFELDQRLQIPLPVFQLEWKTYSHKIQEEILLKWEIIRGKIPDRIVDLEKVINKKQAKLEVEEDFDLTCQLNYEIAEFASIINDLWIWYRTNPDMSYTD